ncbi:hypothetical protein V2G26_009672 [Clonostachys chloroleuca]
MSPSPKPNSARYLPAPTACWLLSTHQHMAVPLSIHLSTSIHPTPVPCCPVIVERTRKASLSIARVSCDPLFARLSSFVTSFYYTSTTYSRTAGRHQHQHLGQSIIDLS